MNLSECVEMLDKFGLLIPPEANKFVVGKTYIIYLLHPNDKEVSNVH